MVAVVVAVGAVVGVVVGVAVVVGVGVAVGVGVGVAVGVAVVVVVGVGVAVGVAVAVEMIVTSAEGTSYCPQCEAYARRIEKLEAVAQAARGVIYRQTNIYAPESKKGRLKAALDALEAPISGDVQEPEHRRAEDAPGKI